MKYFDNEYLAQYLEQGFEVKVVVNGDVLAVASHEDLQDSVEGIGYNVKGQPKRFMYKNISGIVAGPHKVDINALNGMGNSDDDKAPGKSQDKPPAGDDEEEKPEVNESKFDRRSHGLHEKVDYWSMIK